MDFNDERVNDGMETQITVTRTSNIKTEAEMIAGVTAAETLGNKNVSDFN